MRPSSVTGDTGGRRQETLADSGRTALPFRGSKHQVPGICRGGTAIPGGGTDTGENIGDWMDAGDNNGRSGKGGGNNNK